MGSVVSSHVQTSRLGAVSKRSGALHFWRPTRQAPPYPSTKTCSLFGSVSSSSYRQALDAPFVVKLFTADLLSIRPRVLSSTRSSLSPKKSSRRRRALAEPDEDVIDPELPTVGFGPTPA